MDFFTHLAQRAQREVAIPAIEPRLAAHFEGGLAPSWAETARAAPDRAGSSVAVDATEGWSLTRPPSVQSATRSALVEPATRGESRPVGAEGQAVANTGITVLDMPVASAVARPFSRALGDQHPKPPVVMPYDPIRPAAVSFADPPADAHRNGSPSSALERLGRQELAPQRYALGPEQLNARPVGGLESSRELVVRITIGQIDVRAIQAPVPTRRAPPVAAPRSQSLEEYLRGGKADPAKR